MSSSIPAPLQGKVIAVAGGGGGIGKATALQCAEYGASGIALGDINAESVELVKKEM